jgi:hypothetical protein
VVDTQRLGPIFTPLDLDHRLAAVKAVAQAHHFALVLAKENLVSAAVADITDEVLKALPPGGPITE